MLQFISIILATILCIPIINYLKREKGYSQWKAILIGVGLAWLLIIGMTMITDMF
jgi:hypothetical protein